MNILGNNSEKDVINNLLREFLKFYNTKFHSEEKIFEDFLTYFYFIFDGKLENIRSNGVKNKYIKIRANILEYIIKNKKMIILSILKKYQNR
jgi:hypothetical protein